MIPKESGLVQTFNVPRKSRYELRPVSVTPHNTPTSPGYRPPFRPQISSIGDYKTYRDRDPEPSLLRRYNNYEDLRATNETPPTTYKETPPTTTYKSILKNPQTSTESYESEKVSILPKFWRQLFSYESF